MNIITAIGQVGRNGVTTIENTGKTASGLRFTIYDVKTFPSGKTFTESYTVEWWGKHAKRDGLSTGVSVACSGEVGLWQDQDGKAHLKINAQAVRVIGTNTAPAPQSAPVRREAPVEPPPADSGGDDQCPF